jgi:hypothetical protein
MRVARGMRMPHRPSWTLEPAPPTRPRGKVRRLLTASAIAIGSVCGVGPLAACNYKGCRYDDATCQPFPKPNLDLAAPPSPPPDLTAPGDDLAGDDGGGHD